jgi:glucose-6-phosphate 1-dehydrogenase
VFVAFGVTGDLMRLKVLPALLALHRKGDLPQEFEIIGVSRKEWEDAQLREYIKNSLIQSPEDFLERFTFLQGDVSEKELFERLTQKVGGRVALLYFSLSPVLYKPAFEHLIYSSLVFENMRIMIEKPFGRNGKEARELDEVLHSAFDETQLYRVDHYLAKETLRDFPTIDLEQITKIELWFLQKEGLEKRGVFYDATGCLRDVGQNHMLEMLGALGTGAPREEILKDVRPLTAQEVASKTRRAQWHGYHKIVGVAPNSQTETYFSIEARWRDAALFMEAGKYREEERKEITITFRDGTVRRFPIEPNSKRGEHEGLIYECIQGENKHFITSKEAALQWGFVDPIIESWERGVPPLTQY